MIQTILNGPKKRKLVQISGPTGPNISHLFYKKEIQVLKYHMDFLFLRNSRRALFWDTLYLFWNSRISFSFWDTVKEFQAQSFINEYQDCILLTSVVQSPTTLSMTISRYSVGLNNTSLMFLLKIVHPSKGLSLVEWSWGSWEQILVKNGKQHPWVGPWRWLLQNGEDF